MANPGDNNYLSTRDANQVLRAAFDDNTKRLRTDSTFTGTLEVHLDAADDNVAISDGTDTLEINPDGSINIGNFPATQDVNVVSSVEIEVKNDVGNPLSVQAVDFDIRDLDATQDNVAISDGVDTMVVNPDGSINTQITGEVSIEISAADGDNIAISDGVDTMSVNADGSINITDNGGSLTVDQGTTPWIVDGSGFTQPVSGTVTANQGTSPWVDNITQFGSNPVVTGTGASGLGIPRVTVSNDSSILATQSGAWTVIANAGTNLNTSALALDTTVTGLQVTQGSTTAGEKGPLVQGAVTTAAPTYITGQTNPLSLTTTGSLRVDNSANTQPISGTVNAKAATPTVGTITQAAITVGTSAVRATVTGSAPSATRSVLLVSPDSASTAKFYMGSATVTSSGATRGFQLLGGDQVAFNSDAGDYYIISDTAAQTVYIVEQA